MAEYKKLERQLAKVRRAWKRTAALSGLSIVCLEALGLVTLALLVDWMYLSSSAVRLAIFGGVLLAVGALLVRHVVSPLVRRISDEQLALFVEEHNDKFEGSLITAAELRSPYGPAVLQAGRLSHDTTPADMVDAVVESALARADKLRAASVVDFRRLRKYGVAAIIVLAVYGAMCLTVPSVGRHAGRVLAPWQVAVEDQSQTPLMSRPITFTLSKGDTSVLRGSALELEAVLSRPTEDPVTLSFRLVGDTKTPWRSVAFADAQKHNGFAVTLPDINDETEYFVSSGAYHSPTHKVGVYDALVIGGVEVTTRFPAYMQLPDRVETQLTGDIVAPIGSNVTIRVLTNRPLTGGKLTWQGGRQQDLAVGTGDQKHKASAWASFDVAADASYNFSVFDATNQRADGSSVASVRAMKDAPPAVTVKFPTDSVLATPFGEVNFEIEAADDWGVASAELVYERLQCPDRSLKRVPLRVARGVAAKLYPDVAQATLRFSLEELTPRVMPQEIINYYVEAVDRKGQKTVSEYKTMVVGNFEDWPTVKASNPHDPTYLNLKDVREFVQASWKLQQDKPTLTSEQYNKGCVELADSMIDPGTRSMYPFFGTKHVPKEKVQYIDGQLAAAQKALRDYDASAACNSFRIVLAEITLLGMNRNEVDILTADIGAPRGSSTAIAKSPEELLHAITVAVDPGQPPPDFKPEMAKQAEQLRKKALQLKKEQEEIVNEAQAIAKANGPADGPKKDSPKAQKQAAALAVKQKALADKTAGEGGKSNEKADPNAPKLESPAKPDDGKKDADPDAPKGESTTKPDDAGKTADPNAKSDSNAKSDPNASPEIKTMSARIEDASQAMKDAASNMEASTGGDKRMEQAIADAKRAAQELDRAALKLETVRQEKLAQAIAQVEAQAGKILNEQKELNKDTQAAGSEPPKPNDSGRDKEFKNLAIRQAQLIVNAKALMASVEQLHEWSVREGKGETTKHIEDAGNHLTRGEVDQKMTNAVVELTSKHASQADQEQHDAIKALEGAVASMRKASDSMAADREAQLKRAADEAGQIEQGLVKLGAEPKAATSGPASRPAANDPTKNDPSANGGDKQPALSDKEKKALKEDIAYNMARLAQHLQDRDFAAREDVSAIQQAGGKAGQLDAARPDDKRKLDDLAALVRRVGEKLETEYETTLEAKKLMAAQREECPPSYRQLVNKYYEALSEAAK